jgi:hypothetical protein
LPGFSRTGISKSLFCLGQIDGDSAEIVATNR